MNQAGVLRSSLCFGAALFLGLWSLAALRTAEAQEKPFFEGKTLRIITGFAPGGGTDLRARLFARHLGKYLPGKVSYHRPCPPRAVGLPGGIQLFVAIHVPLVALVLVGYRAH